MRKIIETKQLEFEKSSFLIDLVKHDNEALYIEVVQRIHNQSTTCQTIKINPTILMDIVSVLLDMYENILHNQTKSFLPFTEKDKQSIQTKYLKGIPIKDLAIHYDISPKLIEMILRNRGIVIMSDLKSDKNTPWKKRKTK